MRLWRSVLKPLHICKPLNKSLAQPHLVTPDALDIGNERENQLPRRYRQKFTLGKLLCSRIKTGDQKQDEAFRRSTRYYWIKIVKVLSSLTSVGLTCIVAKVLNL